MAEAHGKEIKISLCIPAYNRPGELERCLISVKKAKKKPWEVIVSDDSKEEVREKIKEICKKYGARYLPGPRKGLAMNEKNLVKNAKGNFIVFFGDDNQVTPEYFEEMEKSYLEYAEKYGERIIITGKEIRDGVEVTPGELTFLGYQAKEIEDRENAKAIVICSTLFPKEFLDRVYFDPVLDYGLDEVDLVYQALYHGYRIIFCSSIINIHLRSPAGREKYHWMLERNRVYEMLKIYGVYQRNILKFILYLFAGPLHLLLHAIKTWKFSLIKGIPSAMLNFYHFYRRWKWR
ncbi:hypothetical protein DRQ18_01115 [bacterium]|nr:MAG: hypothetical protein DRQ18_01115 [bacterium]